MLRVLALLLLAGLALPIAPVSAAPCTADGPDAGCDASTRHCDAHVGANVITTTHITASVDCVFLNDHHCFLGVSVGQRLLDPDVERWCAM